MSRALGFLSQSVQLDFLILFIDYPYLKANRGPKKWSNFWEDPEQTSYDQLNINSSHPIKLTRLAIKSLLGRDKKGVVCIISSIAGIYGSYSAPLYTATKYAMVGFVRSMAPLEELEGIKVTTICPGYDNSSQG